LTAGYLTTTALVNGGANVVGGAVQREANDWLNVPQNSDPTDTGSMAVDFASGAIGGAVGTKVASVRYPLPNVRKELALIANSNRRSLRPQRVGAFNQYAKRQAVLNTTAGSVTGTATTNFLGGLLPSWQSFLTFGWWQTPVVTSRICFPTENGGQVCQ
jgi:hypothetical protein